MNTALTAILKQFRKQLTAIEVELHALQQERGYRVLVEHAADLLMRLQSDGTIRYASPASWKVLGCAPSGLVGQSLLAVTCADDEALVGDALYRAAGGEDVEQIARLQVLEAEPVRVNLKLGVLAYADHGAELYAVAQALAEAASAPADTPETPTLATFVQLALGAHCLIGEDGYFREVNPRFCEVLGCTEDELRAEPLLYWVHPDDRDATGQALDRLTAGERVASYRNRYRGADGSYHWFEWASRPAEDGLIYASAHDVTNQVYAELALEASNERNQQILEHISDAFFILDPAWRFTYVNPQAEALLDRSRAELLGRVIWEAFPDMVDSPFYEAYHDARREGRRVTFEAYYRPLEAWFSARALPGEEGLSVYLQDVTERKQAEATLERYARSLEAVKAELEIKAAELERTVEQLDAAKSDGGAGADLDTQRQILGILNQEIRSPMNSIIGLTSILLDSGLDDDQYHCAETIRVSTETLLSIVNDILDYSQIETGQVQLEDHPFQVRACVEDAMDVVALQATRKGLELSYRLAPNVPSTIIGDETRLRQILINLLSNAVKFTHDGAVSITVQAETENDEHRLYVSVQDTGVGIPEDRQAHLFDPFSQADSAVAQAYGGSGLGLSICRQLCEMMGGHIGLESEPGVGTTFHFMIRVKAAVEAASGEAGAEALLAGRRLLVVDDNDANRWIVQEQARAWGMTVCDCSTPEEVLRVLESDQPFDVAMLDGQPDHGEAALLKHIKTLRPDLPVIRLGTLDDLSEGISGDYAAWLPKPLKQKVLQQALMTALYPEVVLDASASNGSGTALKQARPLRILLAEDDLASQKVARAMLHRLGHRVDVAESGAQVLFALEQGAFDVVLVTMHLTEMNGPDVAQRLRQTLDPARRPVLIAMTTEADLASGLADGIDGMVGKPVKLEELEAVLAGCEPLDAEPMPEVNEPAAFAEPDDQASTAVDAVPAFDAVPPAMPAEPMPAEQEEPWEDAATQSLDAEVLQWTNLPPEDPIFDFMLDIMESCLRTARDLLRHVQGEVTDEDRGILESSIHALKSNCQILDVETLVTLSEQVETACVTDQMELLARTIRQLVWALEEFQHTVYGHITASKEANAEPGEEADQGEAAVDEEEAGLTDEDIWGETASPEA